MKKEEILQAIRSLAASQGFYGRLLMAEETKNKVRELFLLGYKKKDIALQLGVCAATVTKYTKNINNDKN